MLQVLGEPPNYYGNVEEKIMWIYDLQKPNGGHKIHGKVQQVELYPKSYHNLVGLYTETLYISLSNWIQVLHCI